MAENYRELYEAACKREHRLLECLADAFDLRERISEDVDLIEVEHYTDGHSGPGWYVWHGEYRDEGSELLFPPAPPPDITPREEPWDTPHPPGWAEAMAEEQARAREAAGDADRDGDGGPPMPDASMVAAPAPSRAQGETKPLRATYRDRAGALLWAEDWYLRRMFGVGQRFIRDSREFVVLDARLIDGEIAYVVEPDAAPSGPRGDL